MAENYIFPSFCDFITLEKGHNSRNTVLKTKIFCMHTARRILMYVCYLVKFQILVVLNVHTVNFSKRKKWTFAVYLKSDNSVSYLTIFIKFGTWMQKIIVKFFCYLTNMKICISSFLLYKAWRPFCIYANYAKCPKRSTGTPVDFSSLGSVLSI